MVGVVYSCTYYVAIDSSYSIASTIHPPPPQAKHLQFVSGVHATTYWMATFAWDLLNCIPPVAIAIIFFAAFQIEQYMGINLVAVLLLLVSQCGSGRVFALCMCVCVCVCVVCVHVCACVCA